MQHPHTYEPLGGGIKACVTREHRFGTDAFLLSDFAAPRAGEPACDLCSGCGIVALLWYRRRPQAPGPAHCVELQPLAVRQLRLGAEASGLAGRVVPVLGDLRRLHGLLPAGAYSLVTCNPPYKEAARGLASAPGPALLARHEAACTLEEVCAAAARLLRRGGRFCLCQRPERLPDVLGLLRRYGMEPKRLRFVQKRPETPPWLVLVEGRRGGGKFLSVAPPLYIQDGAGGFSPELRRIYGQQPGREEQGGMAHV